MVDRVGARWVRADRDVDSKSEQEKSERKMSSERSGRGFRSRATAPVRAEGMAAARTAEAAIAGRGAGQSGRLPLLPPGRRRAPVRAPHAVAPTARALVGLATALAIAATPVTLPAFAYAAETNAAASAAASFTRSARAEVLDARASHTAAAAGPSSPVAAEATAAPAVSAPSTAPAGAAPATALAASAPPTAPAPSAPPAASVPSAPDVPADAVVVNVRDYGAFASTGADAAPGIVRALEAAKRASDAGKPVVVTFPQGRYDIYPDQAFKRTLFVSNTTGADASVAEKSIGILVEGMRNVTVDGGGSQFMFHGKMTTFAAIESENVSFRNFSVDFQVPTVVDVTVESVEGNSAIVYVPECYTYRVENGGVTWSSDVSPYTGVAYWTARNAMDYTQRFDTVRGLTWRGDTANNPLFRNSTIAEAGAHRLRVTWASKPDEVRPGMCYQMRPTKRDHPGTFLWKCKDVVLSNLDIRFLHGFGMVGQSSENITLDDVDFQADMTRGHTTAGYADFVQMSGCKGAIEVKNCLFSNPHDDPINVHGTYLQVTRRMGDNKIEVSYQHHETAGFPSFFVGDEVEFFRKSDLLQAAPGRFAVTAVDGPDGRGGSMGEGTGSLTKIVLTFDRALPQEVQPGSCVAENVTYTPSVNIHDNVFKETPTRGILVTTRGRVRIEHNRFDGMGMAAIYISNDNNSWYESGRVEDVTIADNVFERGGAQAILIDPTKYPMSGTQTVHRDITVKNNTFFTAAGAQTCMAVDAKSVDGLRIEHNRIWRGDPGVQVQLPEGAHELAVGQQARMEATATSAAVDGQLYWMGWCRNVVLAGNEYDGGLNARLSMVGMQASDVTVSDDAVKLNADVKLPAGDEVVYESSDPAVLAVAPDGTVSAKAPGEATVTMRVRSGARLVYGGSQTFEVHAADDAAADGDAAAANGAAAGGDAATADGATAETMAADGATGLVPDGSAVGATAGEGAVAAGPARPEVRAADDAAAGGDATAVGDTADGSTGAETATPAAVEASAPDAVASSDAFLAEGSSVTGLAAGIAFTPETTGYFTSATTQERTVAYRFVARDAGARLAATFNGADVEAAGTARLGAGLNVLEVRVTAADGATTRTYRFVVLRAGDSSTGLASLAVDGDAVPLEEGRYAYTVRKDAPAEAAVVARAASAASRVLMSANGAAVADGRVPLHAGVNTVSILVVPETGAAPTRYELTVKVPQPENAALEQLALDGATLDAAFAPETLEYRAVTDTSDMQLTAQAQEPSAIVELVMGNAVVARGTGSLAAPFAVRAGETPVRVRVTSPDASVVRTYTVQVLASGEVYLSDMAWTSATAGDGRAPGRDASVDGAALSLWDGQRAQAFKKGLGTHANSEIVFDLAGRGFTTFTAQVGVDFETNVKPHEANVVFEVYVDGHKRFESPVMHTGDASVSTGEIDVAGASTLKLVARGKDNIYSAHADWADARLSKPFEARCYAVRAVSADEQAGSVTLDGVGNDGTAEVASTVTAHAVAQDGYVFAGWFDAATGAALGEEADRTWVVYADASIEARFTKQHADGDQGGSGGDSDGSDGEHGNGNQDSGDQGGAGGDQDGSGDHGSGNDGTGDQGGGDPGGTGGDHGDHGTDTDGTGDQGGSNHGTDGHGSGDQGVDSGDQGGSGSHGVGTDGAGNAGGDGGHGAGGTGGAGGSARGAGGASSGETDAGAASHARKPGASTHGAQNLAPTSDASTLPLMALGAAAALLLAMGAVLRLRSPRA